ncbi:hypothetical protein HRbin26_00992 [bacterium HR26]|nr:hypothetical protein HRbin26_00992 [bacterium HR26]
MEPIRRVGELEIEEDLDFQRRMWRVQQIGWALLVLVVVAALLGLFGKGPLSRAVAGGTGVSFTVEYERFGRYKAPMRMTVHIGPGVAQQGQIRLWLAREYLDAVQIQQIVPEPVDVLSQEDGTTYVIQVADSSAPTTVTFDVLAERFGLQVVQIRLGEGQPVRFRQLIYP